MKQLSRNKYFIIAVVVLVLAYASSYYVLSRRGFGYSDSVHGPGFWFFPPEKSAGWLVKNYGLVGLYYPLILLDCALGTGRPPANEPLWSIE